MKLHLGSGNRYLKGYIHVDISSHDHIDVKTSVDKLTSIKSDSVDEIYASHVLEYFDQDEVRAVLKEWRRVLKKNGILRLAVPNLEALISVYQTTKNIEIFDDSFDLSIQLMKLCLRFKRKGYDFFKIDTNFLSILRK